MTAHSVAASPLRWKVELILDEAEEWILASFRQLQSAYCFAMSIVFGPCAQCCLSLFGRKVFV